MQAKKLKVFFMSRSVSTVVMYLRVAPHLPPTSSLLYFNNIIGYIYEI